METIIIIITTIVVFVLAMLYLFIVKFTSFPDWILFQKLNKKRGVRTTGKVIDVINGFGRFQLGSDKVGIQALIFMVEFKATDGKTYRNKYKTNFTSCLWLSRSATEILVIYDERNPKIMTIDRANYQSKIKLLKEKEWERKKAFNDLES